MYSLHRLTLTPLTAFATPMLGDTLFGQLCWALREAQGNDALNQALTGYQSQPFVVLSDAMPAGFIPRPLLPPKFLGQATDIAQRKQWKKIQWIPESLLQKPLSTWLAQSLNQQPGEVKWQAHPHNSINRLTDTTGTDGFAPYSVEEYWYAEKNQFKQALQLYAVLNDEMMSCRTLQSLMQNIGNMGFGKDASTGLGKFRLESCEQIPAMQQGQANAWLALAPCAPQGLGYDAQNSYWQPFTRYGRHGNWAVLCNPFKNPVLLANTGSVFTGQALQNPLFIGQGLGGEGKLSKTLPETVQQGYAPVIGLHLPQPSREERP